MANNQSELLAMPLNGRRLETMNTMIVWPLAISLNVLLLRVMRAERDAALRSYAKALSINCACDMMFTTISVVSGFQYEMVDGCLAILVGGIYDFVPGRYHWIGAFIFLTSLYMALYIYPTIFYFRYSIIVREREPSLVRLTLTLVGVASFISATIILSTVGDAGGGPTCSAILRHPMWTYGGASVDDCLVASPANAFFWITYVIFAALLVAGYTSIVWFNVHIFRTIHANRMAGGSTSRVQRQLNTFLTIQLILPLVCGTIPMGLAAMGTLGHQTIVGVHLLAMMHVEWIPALNPLIAIVFMSNYRRRVARLFRCGRGTNVSAYSCSAPNCHDPRKTTTKTISRSYH